MLSNTTFNRLSRFLLVGAIATALQYAILIAVVEGAGAPPTLASAIGFTVSACVSYRLNYSFTFASEVAHSVAAPRFVATAAVGLCLNSLVMLLIADRWGFPYLLAQLLATAIALSWNFIVNQAWSFETNTRK